MDNDQPVMTVFHRSINRTNLLMGCDRGLFLLLSCVVASLLFSAMTRYTIISGGLLWLFGLAALRAMAKADPHMKQVFVRSAFNQRRFYPSRSCYRKVGRKTPKKWL